MNAWLAFAHSDVFSWFSKIFKICTQLWGPVASVRLFAHLILGVYLTAFADAGSHHGKYTSAKPSAKPAVCTGTALLAQGRLVREKER